MSKIFFNGGLIYDKDRLPDEKRAMSMIKTYIGYDVVIPADAAEALSAGIDVKINGNWFKVELSSDKRK